MRLNQDDNPARFVIRAHGAGHVIVNNERYEGSLVLTPEQIRTGWPVAGMEDLDDSALEWLLEGEPEVILLGTGEQQTFPSARLVARLAQRGVGIECMDTGAACRTYAVLSSEGRRVALGLILQMRH
ncbi:MAG: Mth938-like domain-containing protein [Halothiobacillaceae bacterium]